ncbi:MAG: serine hydrolase [Bacteroidetes bacterium]|nr:serine hydrolase [Bacteroidota bacterium]
MKKLFTPILLIFSLTFLQSQTYDFTAIDNLLNNNSSSFHGKAVCIVRHYDTLIYYKAMGGIDSNTVSQIASATKTFSGALILRLAQEGLFDLDDSIGKFRPKATLVGKGGSTIRQNFSHTAGWDGSTNYQSSSTLTLQEAADSIIQNDPQIYIPGTKFKYTGVSMHVAGAIAEQVAGIPWDTLFAKKIAKPLDLSNTEFCLKANNPRIAGGICSSPSDIMKFARFIQKYGKNKSGVQVVDSIWMLEMWKDQTNAATQLASPYPTSPPNNNPYSATEIYYGIGDWLDIYNPTQMYQEQISGAGAFGTSFWINRCKGITGVLYTVAPSLYAVVESTWFQIMDVVRNTVPRSCYSTTGTYDSKLHSSNVTIYPNPANDILYTNNNSSVNEITIYDLMGEKILKRNNVDQFDISALSSGIYFVEQKNNKGQVSVSKIIKQ